MSKRKAKLNIYSMLMLFVMIPLVTCIITMAVQSLYSLRSCAKDDTSTALTAVGEGLKQYCISEYTHTKKLPVNTDFINSVKEEDIDLAIFDTEGIVCTSANNIGQSALDVASLNVLQSGETYYDKNIIINNEEYYGYFTPINVDGVVVGVAFAGEPVNVLLDNLTIHFNRIAILCGVLILLFTVLALLFAKVVARPLQAASKHLSVLVTKNLSIPPITEGSIVRETINILDSTNLLHKTFSDTLRYMSNTADTLSNEATAASNDASTMNSNINQINLAVNELANSAGSMAENVQDLNNDMCVVDSNINDVRDITYDLQEVSESMLTVNNQASEAITSVFKNNEDTVQTIEEVAEQINSNYESIQHITNAVDLITNIAKQTNLLALNASIEAARAGEAGRGFAVVADSIQSLSEQSNEGANNIRQLVTSILVQSVSSVEKTNAAVNMIKEGQSVINSTMSSFEELNQIINKTSESVNTLRDKARELDEVKVKALEAVAELSAISEENAASSQEMTASLDTVSSAMVELNAIIESVAKLAEETNNNVKDFTI